MGEGFVETHTKLATVHNTVSTASKTYIQVNKPSAFKQPASLPQRQDQLTGNERKPQAMATTPRRPFEAPLVRRKSHIGWKWSTDFF